MKITADTNVLLRAILDDHPSQSPQAQATLLDAEIVAVSLPTLCEFVWVLRTGYNRTKAQVSTALRALIGTSNLNMDRPAVEAGLRLVDAGGDFADGIVAHEGVKLGGEIFATFDARAAKLLARHGETVRLLPAGK
jgi:predicted nucleic-acid-binding protein